MSRSYSGAASCLLKPCRWQHQRSQRLPLRLRQQKRQKQQRFLGSRFLPIQRRRRRRRCSQRTVLGVDAPIPKPIPRRAQRQTHCGQTQHHGDLGDPPHRHRQRRYHSRFRRSKPPVNRPQRQLHLQYPPCAPRARHRQHDVGTEEARWRLCQASGRCSGRSLPTDRCIQRASGEGA